MTSSDAAPVTPERSTAALVGRLFEASIGMFEVMSVYLGDRLGLYRTLHDGGAATTAELAARARIDERYAREWREQPAGAPPPRAGDRAAAARPRRRAPSKGYAPRPLDPH